MKSGVLSNFTRSHISSDNQSINQSINNLYLYTINYLKRCFACGEIWVRDYTRSTISAILSRKFQLLRFFHPSRRQFNGGYTCDFHVALATRQSLKRSHHQREQTIARVAAALLFDCCAGQNSLPFQPRYSLPAKMIMHTQYYFMRHTRARTRLIYFPSRKLAHDVELGLLHVQICP